MPDTLEVARLRRKLAQKDRKIAGLQRRTQDLERQVATLSLANQNLPKVIERAVQFALSNVRMIPVLGLGHTDKIVSIRADPPETPRKESP